MEKLIQELLKWLRAETIVALALVCITIALGETDIIPNGEVEPNTESEFMLNTICILLTIIVTPGILRLFHLYTTRGLRRMNNDEALSHYHHLSATKVGIMALCMLMDAITYYLTMTTTGILCLAATIMLTLYYNWPTRQRIDDYLAIVNSEQQQV